MIELLRSGARHRSRRAVMTPSVGCYMHLPTLCVTIDGYGFYCFEAPDRARVCVHNRVGSREYGRNIRARVPLTLTHQGDGHPPLRPRRSPGRRASDDGSGGMKGTHRDTSRRHRIVILLSGSLREPDNSPDPDLTVTPCGFVTAKCFTPGRAMHRSALTRTPFNAIHRSKAASVIGP